MGAPRPAMRCEDRTTGCQSHPAGSRTPFSRSGKFSRTRGHTGYRDLSPEILSPRGAVSAPTGLRTHTRTTCATCMRLHRSAGVASHRHAGRKSASFLAPFGSLFKRCLPVVMMLAQALVVGWVDKQRPVSPKRPNMIDDSRSRSSPRISSRILPSALSAVRLPEQLLRSELVSPDRQQIPCVIVCAYAPLMLRLMPGTPPVSRSNRTSWMSTRPKWFARHGLSPPRISKKPKEPSPATIRNQCVHHWPRLS